MTTAGPASVNVPVWDPDGSLALSDLCDDLDADTCVVGLGGTGLTAVLRLRERGVPVVGLDAGTVAGGAAGRNGGLLLAGAAAPHHRAIRAFGRERATRLYRRTVRAIDEVLAAAPGTGLRCGSLRIAADDAEREDVREQLAAMREDGLPAEPYHGPEGAGLRFPHDAAIDPLARCRALARSAVREGATLFERSPAVRIEGGRTGPVRVVTPHGSVRCRRAIVAIDGGLARVLPELAATVRPVRLQMAATVPTGGPELPAPVYYRYGYEYWRRTPDGRIAAGGFRDAGGAAEETDVPVPTEAVQRRLDALLRDRIGTDAPVAFRWAAITGFGRTGLPFVGPVRPGVTAAGGYDGTGNLLGAVAGRALADHAAGDDPTDLKLFLSD